MLNRIKLYEKRDYYSKLFKKIGKNSKLLWDILNGLIKKANNKSEITELKFENKILHEHPSICEAFNTHFVTAGQRVQNTIERDKDIVSNDSLRHVPYVSESFKFPRVTEMQICKIVEKNGKQK